MTRTSLVYVLAFHPDKSRGEGFFHELKVKVAASGAKVSARPGYYERRGFRRLSPLERNLSAADVIANEIPMDEIPMRVLAAAFASGEPAASVPLLLEIPGDRFLNGQRTADVEIYVYATDAEGSCRTSSCSRSGWICQGCQKVEAAASSTTAAAPSPRPLSPARADPATARLTDGAIGVLPPRPGVRPGPALSGASGVLRAGDRMLVGRRPSATPTPADTDPRCSSCRGGSGHRPSPTAGQRVPRLPGRLHPSARRKRRCG
jgi:hypothetical protein